MLNVRLDLFSLKLFIDIVDLRSIGKGAERNCIAVSAASKRMSDLEHTLGVQLLLRQSRGVVPTEAGLTMYKGMQETLGHLAQVAADVREHANTHVRPVRVSANLVSLAHSLPELVKAFSGRHPEVPVQLEEHATTATLQALMRGDADIGLVAPVVPYPESLSSVRYQVMRHVVIVPLGHPLGQHASVSFDRAAAYDFVCLENEGGWDRLLRREAQERGLEFKVRVRLNSFDAMCRMVATGLGIAIVPLAMAQTYAKVASLRVLGLDESWADVPIDLCARDLQSMSPGVRLLWDFLCQRSLEGDDFPMPAQPSLMGWKMFPSGAFKH